MTRRPSKKRLTVCLLFATITTLYLFKIQEKMIFMANSNQNPENPLKNIPDADLKFLMAQYQVLSDHALSQDTMMWDIPSLLFVGQSLLWSIALDVSVSLFLRSIISFVAVLISFMSFQLFIRHHILKTADDEQLYSIEEFFIKNKIVIRPLIIHNRLNKRTLLSGRGSKLLVDKLQKIPVYSRNPLSKQSSFRIWTITFLIFLGISLLIFGYNIYLLASPFFSL